MKNFISKNKNTITILLTTYITTSPAHAQCSCGCDPSTPAGIMELTNKKKNQWMLGYMGMFTHSSGMRNGSHDISNTEIFKTISHETETYEAAINSMDMEMHMLHIMYAPSENLTLTLSPQYMLMDMEMVMADGMKMNHSSNGWSDLLLAASFPLWHNEKISLSGSLGISLPTGNVDEKHDGHFLHYMMQHGSGTVDVIPTLTATTEIQDITFGLRYQAIVRTDNKNESGFSFGDSHTVDAWLAKEIVTGFHGTARLTWNHQDDIYGHYIGDHHHAAPADFQHNYGGSNIDLGIGINHQSSSGIFKDCTAGIEFMLPLYLDYHGIQPEKQIGVNWSLMKSF